MSARNAKKDRKMEVVSGQAEASEIAEDIETSIKKMVEDRDKKVAGAREHLVSQLKVTSDKYRTANGVMSAYMTIRDIVGTDYITLSMQLDEAKAIASRMSGIALEMAEKAKTLAIEDLHTLCDDFYDPEFCESFSDGDEDLFNLAKQLMLLELCQNVGPAAQDVSDFWTTANEEIAKMEAELAKQRDESGAEAE